MAFNTSVIKICSTLSNSRFWLIIGKDLVEVLNNIYLQGELTDTMKSSIITMMYKNKGDYKDQK
jgi:hypothetical protein